MANVDYSKISADLGRLRCSKHGQSATCVINDGEPIFLNCCCAAFEEELTGVYYEEIDRQLSEEE